MNRVPEVRAEIEDRTLRLRAAMADDGYAAVVIAGNTEFQQKGYIRYFADWRLFGGTAYIVMPFHGAPSLFMGPGAQAEWAGELSAIADTRAVPDKIGAVIEALREMTVPGDHVGVVGLDAIMPFADAQRLAAGIDAVTITDATDTVEAIWAVLSEGDLAAVEAAHARVAGVFDTFRDTLRPGLTERDVVAEAIAAGVRAGCLEGVIHLNHDRKSGTRPATDRRIERDDIYKVFMEFLTPQGYLIELGGCFSFRVPPDAWRRKFDLVAFAMSEAAAASRPGTVADDVVRVIRRTYENAGAEIVGRRLWDFHGQGMHSLMRPFGLPGSRDPVSERMMINIHPGLLTADGLGISATSNYVVTPEGGHFLGGFEHRWHVVG